MALKTYVLLSMDPKEQFSFQINRVAKICINDACFLRTFRSEVLRNIKRISSGVMIGVRRTAESDANFGNRTFPVLASRIKKGRIRFPQSMPYPALQKFLTAVSIP